MVEPTVGAASDPAPEASPPPEPDTPRGPRINEDWAATIVGLVLVVLVLSGVISKGMVP